MHAYTYTRRSIMADNQQQTEKKNGDPEKKNGGDRKTGRRLFDKSLGTAASLSKLLPTGTTLAFQTMAPSFTKGGECHGHDVNFAFTWGLIGFLTFLCAVLCFTDSVTVKDDTYYGLALYNGFWFFNHEPKLPGAELDEIKKRMSCGRRDFLHAFLSAAVFVALAFCDAGVQRCLVPRESGQWEDFLRMLPLAVGFLASFLFMTFPSKRKGIGEEGAWEITTKVAESNELQAQP
uniref:Uncharacterized protein n=1 Tax=Avena sativa TaxID=4498 RepID=A0ACD5Z7A2_AVESA